MKGLAKDQSVRMCAYFVFIVILERLENYISKVGALIVIHL